MKITHKGVLTFFLLYSLISASFGQTSDVDSTNIKMVPLEEVIIKASRSESNLSNIPSSVQTISKRLIQGSQATLSLEESLRNVPGVFVSNRYNFSQGDRITIRGIGARSQFGVRGIKMILDNIPLTFPDGQTQLNNIDIASLGSVEVLKGASSVLYGNSAGGVIYLTSEEPAKDRFVLIPSYLLGSFGLQKAQLKTTGTTGKLDYLINTSRTYSEGYRDFSSSLFYNLNSKFRYKLSEKSVISFIANGNDSPYLLNPGSLDKKTAEENPTFSRQFNQLQGAGKISRQLQSGLVYDLKVKNHVLNLTGYGILRDLYNPIPGRIIDLARKSGGFRATYLNYFKTGLTNATLSAGYDLEYQSDNRKEFENEGIAEEVLKNLQKEDIIKSAVKGELLLRQQESILGNGAFLKLDANRNKLYLSIGIRYDNYQFKVEDEYMDDLGDNSGNKDLQQLSPAVGIIYKFNRALNLYSNYSSAFQTPSANEFGNLPSGAGGFNQNLKPERIKSFEAGVRGNTLNEILSYDLSLFYMNIYDQLIGYQTADANSDEVFYRNAGKTRNIGLETLFSFNFFNTLNLDLSYAFNNYSFVEYVLETDQGEVQLKGNKVPGVPASRFFAAIRTYPLKGFSAEINFQQVGKSFANDFNGPAPGEEGVQDDFVNSSYSQLDLRFSYEKRFGNFHPKLYSGINNILNQRYNGSIVPNAAGNRFFEPSPGINWYVGVTIPMIIIKEIP